MQKDAEKAEKELQSRYKKLSAVPSKPKSIKSEDQFFNLVENGPDAAEEIVKSLKNIDLINSNKVVMNKLGGEFDYEEFVDEVNTTASSVKKIFDSMNEELEIYKIEIPDPLTMNENDKSN